MKVTTEKNEKVANMVFATIYPLYLNRLEKNDRTNNRININKNIWDQRPKGHVRSWFGRVVSSEAI